MSLHNLWINRPAARRRRQRQWVTALHAENLTMRDVERLAEYNAQVSGGLLHSENYMAWMADLQERYDRAISSTQEC